MLSETDVIISVCTKLESLGYKTRQRLKPTKSGINIVAVKDGAMPIELYIQTKGEANSKNANVQLDVADALYKALTILALRAERDQVMPAIAFANNKEYQKHVSIIQPILDQLGIVVFWVKSKNSVEVVSPWEL